MVLPVRAYLRSPQYIMATAYGHSVQWYASSDPLLVAHAVLRCHRVIHHEPPALRAFWLPWITTRSHAHPYAKLPIL